MSQPQRFAGQGDTAADWKGWQQQYHEFYNAALIQTTLPSSQTINDGVAKQLNKGSVPLLMLHYNYNKLSPNAADKGYITLDSAGSRVYDGPNMGASPYTTGTVFSVAVALPAGCDNVPLYVGSEFWYGNTPAPAALDLDLGDGLGWRTVSLGSIVQVAMGSSSQQATGSSSPAHSVLVRLPGTTTTAGARLVNCLSLAIVPDLALGLLASRTWPGYTGQHPYIFSGNPYNWVGPAKAIAWIKYAPSNVLRKLRRPLVFVEGIDFPITNGGGVQLNYPVQRTGAIPLSSPSFRYISAAGSPNLPGCQSFRNGTAGWNEMVNYNTEYKPLEKLPELRQQLQASVASGGGDYDIIYLDFSDGAGLIQHNAMVLVELLEWINNPANRTTDSEETLLVGASMGGQVARFALAWMEQQGLRGSMCPSIRPIVGRTFRWVCSTTSTACRHYLMGRPTR